MVTDEDLQELLHYQPGKPILSIYLNTDPVLGNSDFHRQQLRSMLKDVALSSDLEAVFEYVEHEHDWSGKSLVIISCADEGFFRAYSLAIPVRSRLRISDKVHVKPLADLIDSYGGYGVVVVDKQGARLFHFHLGELQEQEGVVGENIRHTKRGGGSQSPGRRSGVAGQTDYVDEITERNMRDAADFAMHFFAEKAVRRIVIGGTDDNVAMFRSYLPKAWQSLIAGKAPISMQSSHMDVLQRAMEIGAVAEKTREARMVETVITNAAKGKGAVIGLQETLDMLREGRIQTLIIQDGYRHPGGACTACGYLSSKTIDACPSCGEKMDVIPDSVEMAVREVMRMGGEVEVLHADQVGGDRIQIGAVLRY